MGGDTFLSQLCQWLVDPIGERVVQPSTYTTGLSQLPAAPRPCLCFSLGCSAQGSLSLSQGCCRGRAQEPCPAAEQVAPGSPAALRPRDRRAPRQAWAGGKDLLQGQILLLSPCSQGKGLQEHGHGGR